MAKFGNTSVSSLLSASRAAANKRASLEDSIAAYEYDLSPKDQEAYNKYASYLNDRVKQYTGVDPAKVLNYTKTLTSANRTYTSSEISRASTQILYGNQSPQDKLNTVIGLYQRALENGDQNLAQRLEGQAATLQQTIQNTGRGGGGFGGGGGGGAADPQVKGWKAAQGELSNHVELLQEALRTGKINSRQYLQGYTDGNGTKILGIADTMQSLEGIRQQAFDYAKGGNPDAMNFYADLSKTMRSPQYQDFINQAGSKMLAGQAGGSRTYNYNTGNYEFNVPTANDISGYENSPIGALMKLKDESGNNIIVQEGSDLTGNKSNYQLQLPKNMMNQVFEDRQGKDVKSQQFTGYLPGFENTRSTQIGGENFNPYELVFTQDAEGKTINAVPKWIATNPITGQLNRDPVTGQVTPITPNDVAAQAAGADGNDPWSKAVKAAVPVADTIDKLYQKTATSKMFSDANNILGSIGKSWSDFKGKYGNVSGFNPITNMNTLSNYLKDLQGQKAQHDQQVAAEQARQFAETQARLQAQNQAAIAQSAASRGINPNLAKSVVYQNSPAYNQAANNIGKPEFNDKYLGGMGKLYNGAFLK